MIGHTDSNPSRREHVSPPFPTKKAKLEVIMNDHQTLQTNQERVDPKNDGRGDDIPPKAGRGDDVPPKTGRGDTIPPRDSDAGQQ